VLTASRAFSAGTGSAEALPEVALLSQLHGWGVRPRRGQLMMIAGQPGSMKSTFAMWWAAAMNIRTLYISADMDCHTAASRLAAVLSGDTVVSVVEQMGGPGADFYAEHLNNSRLQFAFDPSPTLDDIADELDAQVEAFDSFPDLIVCDNLMNIEAEAGESYQGMLAIMDELHRMGRFTKSAVWVLHHTTEGGTNDPRFPQPRRDIQGKVTQLPEIVLTVALDPQSNIFRAAPVKVRSGRSDANARLYTQLRALPDRAAFGPYLPAMQ
jgi:hypothetical protein